MHFTLPANFSGPATSLRRTVPFKGAYRPRYRLTSAVPKKRRSYQEAMKAVGCPHATLLISDVQRIRAKYAQTGGQVTGFARQEVARLKEERVTISTQAIVQLVRGETWSWVPQP